jgi:dipeptidyl aminopeptidase/acylaminoacyl peptidase
METATGKSRAIFPEKRNVKSLAWSPDGSRLARVRNVHAAEKSQDRLGAVLWQQPQKYDRALGDHVRGSHNDATAANDGQRGLERSGE